MNDNKTALFIHKLKTQIVYWQEETYKAKLETVSANKNILALEKQIIDSDVVLKQPEISPKSEGPQDKSVKEDIKT